MNKYKITVIICTIGIILVGFLMILSTYAYFIVKVNGQGEEIVINTFDENTTIIYNDTSNVSMFNAYTGDEINKTFSIENTSNYNMYYDIVLSNVVNNFIDKSDLVYTLSSTGNGAKRTLSIVPSANENIASNVLIKPHEKHEYTMNITFLKKETDQSLNMNKTFSSNIKVVGSNININDKIYKDSTLLKEIITNYKNEDSDENGIYLTYNSNDGYPIYYYKGDSSLNNNLIFNNMCFKIIRTDENYGIRVIYNGEYINNTCENNMIDISSFNNKSNSNAYVGYMFGNAYSNNYKNEHNNINSSNIKNKLETWFLDKFKNSTNISNNSIYCSKRDMNNFTINGVRYSKAGYGNNNTGYYNLNDTNITYECNSIEDSFGYQNVKSNMKLISPVGLISVDEILFSGENSYLFDLGDYWTITPAYFNGSDAYNYVVKSKKINTSKVNNNLGIKPVISLDKGIILTGGDGSLENPYIVK